MIGFSNSKEFHAGSQDFPKALHDINIELLELLFRVTEMPVEEMKDEASFEELGIDSLMFIEVLSEIRKCFHIDILMSDFWSIKSIKLLADYMWSKRSHRNAPTMAEVVLASVSSEDHSDCDTGNGIALPSPSVSSFSGEGLPQRK